MTDDRGSLPGRLVPFAVGVVLVAMLAAGATGALPMAADQPDGETLVDRVEDRYESAETVVGDATVTAANASAETTESVSFATADPDKSRVSVTHNGSEYVAGTNGSVAWTYDGRNDTVRVWDLDAYEANESVDRTYGNVTDVIGENVTAETRGTTTLEGTEVYVLDLEPTNESVDGNATLWVDTGDYRVHKLRTVEGQNRTTVEFTGVQFNASVHDSTFRPPDDADVTVVSRERYGSFDAAQANTTVDLRAMDNATFRSAAVLTRGGATVALQQYDRDGANVTVAATGDDLPYGGNASESENATTVTVAGENATFVDGDDGNAVVWTDGDTTRAVVADLPRGDLVEAAADVRE